MGRAKEVLRNVARLLGRAAPGAVPQTAGRDLDLADLTRSIGYTPRSGEHFRQALLHRSSIQKPAELGSSNERLEFLGDAVLNLVVAEYLFRMSPEAPEGELTKRRARLVNRKALAVYARAIDLASFISMSPSAAQATGKGSDTIRGHLRGGGGRRLLGRRLRSGPQHGRAAYPAGAPRGRGDPRG